MNRKKPTYLVSEIFASITGLEYAFSKAPKNMRSLVTSFFLFMSAVSALFGLAFNALASDPLLIWNYGSAAVLSLFGGIAFWYTFRQLDAMEDQLNELPASGTTTGVQAGGLMQMNPNRTV
jgi:POT family proton-dependent oligopeptide transporter